MSPQSGLDLNNFYQTIYDFITGKYLPGDEPLTIRIINLIDAFRPYSVVISLILLTGIIYCTIRTRTILHDYIESMHGGHDDHHGHGHDDNHHVGHDESHSHHAEHKHENHEHQEHKGSKDLNPRWQKIISHINSQNPNDWRLAIMECDIILDEMLTKMSYHGDTLGDKLKAVEKSDFLTIDKAWEAHRVRNAIAHEGTSFQINEREAKRVVGLYEEVFKEFHYI